MNCNLVLSIMSDDKPGVVEKLASTIAEHGGNWLESRMTHLAGKFAGILQVSVSDENVNTLEAALAALTAEGIAVVSAQAAGSTESNNTKSYEFNIMGNDRPGIVKEVAQAFSSRHINLEDLDTGCTSMPWSGDPMFTAHGLLQIPSSVDMDELAEQLGEISDQLGVDIELDEPEDNDA